jgi:hypothetical protein
MLQAVANEGPWPNTGRWALGAAAMEAPATSRTEGEIKASAASGDRTRPLSNGSDWA